MKNHYLYINKNESGDIEINYSDGVVSGFALTTCKEDFLKYCDKKADMWLNSTFGNFEGWSKEDRKAIAHKWTIAKNKPEGRYDYYFNFGSKKDIFREEVADLAKSMGITYNLTVE